IRVFKPPNNGVSIVRIEFYAVAASSSLFRGDQRGSASSEGVKDNAPALRTIKNRVGDQRQRLHGRMHRKFGIAGATEATGARVIPDIGTVPTETPQFDIVDMRPHAVFEHEHQLMLRSIKASHAGICL